MSGTVDPTFRVKDAPKHTTRKDRLERKISENLAVDAAKAILRGESNCDEWQEPYLAVAVLAGHVSRYPSSDAS